MVTAPFERLARFEAQALGRPSVRMVPIPPPLGGLKVEEVYQKAEAAIAEIVKQATAQRQAAAHPEKVANRRA